MTDITYENLIEKVSRMFPEYLETDFYKYSDNTLNYSYFGGFILFIVDLINKSDKLEEDEDIKKAFELINYMIDQGDKLANLAVVEGIEGLVQEKKSKEVAKKLLNESGQKLMVEVLKTTGIQD